MTIQTQAGMVISGHHGNGGGGGGSGAGEGAGGAGGQGKGHDDHEKKKEGHHDLNSIFFLSRPGTIMPSSLPLTRPLPHLFASPTTPHFS